MKLYKTRIEVWTSYDASKDKVSISELAEALSRELIVCTEQESISVNNPSTIPEDVLEFYGVDSKGKQKVVKDSHRIMATFHPKVWVNGHATSVGGSYQFDITEQILEMNIWDALGLKPFTFQADELWKSNPISSERPWNGPYDVEFDPQEIEHLLLNRE